MKRRGLCIWLIACIVLSLAGCTDAGPVESQENSTVVSSGEPLVEVLGVPEHVSGEFVSDSGISRVRVDAEVIFPEVDHVDVIEALPRVFTEEEIQSMIARHEDEIGWYDTQTVEPYSGWMPEIEDTSGGVDMYSLWLSNIPFHMTYSRNENAVDKIKAGLPAEQAENYVWMNLHVSYGLSARTGKIGFPPNLEWMRSNEGVNMDTLEPLSEGKAADCTISLEEAIALADAEVHAILPDYEVSAYGQLPLQELGNQKQFYAFRYTRHLNGIPVNNTYSGESMATGEYGYLSGLGVVSVIVNDEGVCSFTYDNPYDVGETVQQDVELLSFEEIWEIFSQVALLSIQHLEIDENLQKNEMNVHEIRFGYMTVLMADGTYQYTPVWDFYATRHLAGTGGYTHADEQRVMYDRSELTINAINGTVIDRTLGY